MATRSLNVVHVLVPRRSKDTVQFLLAPHPRWRAEDGRPLLALPTKKFLGRKAGRGEALRFANALSGILRDDLGIPEGPPPDRLRMNRVRTHLVSPAFGTPTKYAVSPVIARVPVIRHPSVARRLGGEWLTPDVALAQADLSPTARLVLEQAGASAAEWVRRPPETLHGSPRHRAWTVGLLDARDGDMLLFGSIFEEMKPLLCALLRSHSWTRALSVCSADVEDALSEASVNALEHLHTFDPARGSALTWLWSITRNCAVSTLRERGRTFSLASPAAQSAADDIACTALEPPALAEVREELSLAQNRLAQILQAADPLDRLIWQMRMDREMPYAEIASELDMPIGSVATRIHRLRKGGRGEGGPGRER